MVARMLVARLENHERFVKGSEMLDGKTEIHIYGEIQEKVKQKLEIES